MTEANLTAGSVPETETDAWNWGADLLAFVGTVVCAMVFDWEAKDVIWGLWICSLLVGYSFIVWTIATSILKVSGLAFLLRLIGGMFMLVFFTIHFGMFHLVHGIFLNVFFPLIPESFGPSAILALLPLLVRSYWPLILATFISRASDFRMAPSTGKPFDQDSFMKPYANVVRMHILIFVFAGLAILKLSQLAILPVLVFYFVPWKTLRQVFRRAPKPAAIPPSPYSGFEGLTDNVEEIPPLKEN